MTHGASAGVWCFSRCFWQRCLHSLSLTKENKKQQNKTNKTLSSHSQSQNSEPTLRFNLLLASPQFLHGELPSLLARRADHRELAFPCSLATWLVVCSVLWHPEVDETPGPGAERCWLYHQASYDGSAREPFSGLRGFLLQCCDTLAIPAELRTGEDGRSGYDVMLLPLLGAHPPAVL